MQMRYLVGAVAIVVLGAPMASAGTLTTARVKQAIIRESIARYPGNCPCPYSVMRNGRRCGRRSAYSKPGGYAPKCFPEDVTAKDVAEHQAALKR
jgi:hypothetical protein